MKEFYCVEAEKYSECVLVPVIKSEQSNSDVFNYILSYLQYLNEKSINATKKSYVRIAIYNKLKSNFDILSQEDFQDLLKIFKIIYNKLDSKSNLIDKVNQFLRFKGMNIDLYQGVLLDIGVVFLNDAEKDTISYIQYATQRRI